MVSKAFLDLGEAAGPQVRLENVAEPGPWGERVIPESQDLKEDSGAGALVGRRAMTGEMESAVKDAEAKKEKEDFLDTQVQRATLVSRGRTEARGPKVSEAEGEIQDLRG